MLKALLQCARTGNYLIQGIEFLIVSIDQNLCLTNRTSYFHN